MIINKCFNINVCVALKDFFRSVFAVILILKQSPVFFKPFDACIQGLLPIPFSLIFALHRESHL